jgi:hypothetical protein
VLLLLQHVTMMTCTRCPSPFFICDSSKPNFQHQQITKVGHSEHTRQAHQRGAVLTIQQLIWDRLSKVHNNVAWMLLPITLAHPDSMCTTFLTVVCIYTGIHHKQAVQGAGVTLLPTASAPQVSTVTCHWATPAESPALLQL